MDSTPPTTGPLVVNGHKMMADLPSTIEAFLTSINLPPRSVVVEHNGDAVAPSEFAQRMIKQGDRLEIVKIVAGG